MIRAAALAAALIALTGCDAPKPDQELRTKIFMQCLGSVPAGPTATMSNDWSEVVDSCAEAARAQSLRGGGL